MLNEWIFTDYAVKDTIFVIDKIDGDQFYQTIREVCWTIQLELLITIGEWMTIDEDSAPLLVFYSQAEAGPKKEAFALAVLPLILPLFMQDQARHLSLDASAFVYHYQGGELQLLRSLMRISWGWVRIQST